MVERRSVHFSCVLCRGWTELDQRLGNRVRNRDEKMLKWPPSSSVVGSLPLTEEEKTGEETGYGSQGR